MEDESFDLGGLEYDVSQKTITAWSAHVEPKTKAQRTYSRRLSTGAMRPRAASIPTEGSIQSDSPEEKAFVQAVDGDPDPICAFKRDAPAIPGRRRFTRANSMSVVSTEANVRSPPFLMQRSNSVSNASEAYIPTAARSTSLSSLGDSCHDFENVHPNFDPLWECASPKRGAANDANQRGKKKVRSTKHFGRRGLSAPLPLSTSFSNLARYGEEKPKWGKPPPPPALSPFPPKSRSSELTVPDFAESPSDFSLGSARKRGVCGSPLYDFDETSLGGLSTSRSKQSRTRSPLFTPTSTKLPDFAVHSADRKPAFSFGAVEESGNDAAMDSDDGTHDESGGEESGDEAGVESTQKTRPPIPTFVPFSHKKRGAASRTAVAASPRITNLVGTKVSNVDEVIKSMSSYEDLKFITKTLRRERSCCGQSWYVAPPAKWVQERRAAFFHWTTRSLGFTYRSGGNSISYVQVSQMKGSQILKILEETLTQHKEKCKSAETPGKSMAGTSNFSFVDTSTILTVHGENDSGLQHMGAAHPPLCEGEHLSTIDDELMEGLSAMNLEEQDRSQLRGYTPATVKLQQGLCFDIGDSDDDSFGRPVRPSLENHASARDLMSHMGMTPELRKGRRRLSRPPRLSLQSVSSCGTASKMSAASPFPQSLACNLGMGSHMKNMSFDFVGTPMMKPAEQGWGSCPIDGRDWGASEKTERSIIDELTRRLDQNRLDAGFCDGDDLNMTPASISLDLDAACHYRDTPTADSPESNSSPSEEGCIVDKGLSQESPSSGSERIFNFESRGMSQIDEMVQFRQSRRRQTTIAKHKRMSLMASAMLRTASLQNNRKSLFVRPPDRTCVTVEPLPEKLSAIPAFPSTAEIEAHARLHDNACDIALKDEDITHLIFGYLNEHELMCTASLVNSKWADAAAHAHANLMMKSIGCAGDEEVPDDDESIDDHLDQRKETASAVAGIVERPWQYLVEKFPWACFLSEGAFKRVYKVFNCTHRVEEAISVMDVDEIESTGNISVVGAELAVSVMLSSLVRRGVCPNFIATRGVFSCPFQPPQQHWGSADNKRPKGNSYCSPGPRKPKEPSRSKRGRYQYIRMELCDAGDAEDFLKEQEDETVDSNEARMFLFQISFALHAAAVKCSLKHYDVKLLNIFLRRVQSEKSGDVVLRYGLGGHTFALRSARERAIVAKLADYGTANIDSGSNGKQVSIAQFTTLENTPPDFLILGDDACQGHGHDSFGLGLCMLHLFTGHAPYEEILSDVSCPPNLKKRLCQIWECEDEAQYSVVRSVILADVYKDEEGHVLEGEPDDTLYNTLYKFLVLFGIPKLSPALESCKVWVAVKETLATGGEKQVGRSGRGGKKGKAGDITRYRKDCRKYSLSHGCNRYIARARESLEVMEGGMDVLLKLVCFDPQERASALDVLNSSFMIPLREASGQVSHCENDEVLSYTAFSTQN
mmetsp:Transcript_18101/g.28074  ORF Transcript_18101/g.28074 Transcript_18101/m.28074 type:complete len:1449 (+) Transcript_18101:325-4671(+)